MKQVAIGFGLIITALLILFRIAKFSHYSSESAPELWIVVFSIIFFITGSIFAGRLNAPKEHMNQAAGIPDPAAAEASGISKRELEIILLISEGCSNQQIADKLFISENTVKKHVSNIFTKLGTERRTDMIRRARLMGFIG